MENLSTTPSSRRSSFKLVTPPNKYKQIFANQAWLGSWGYTPQDRIKAQGIHIRELKSEMTSSLKDSYFLEPIRQENSPHFQGLFKQCIDEMRGFNPVIKSASKDLVKKSGRYVDLHFGGFQDHINSPTSELLEELKLLIYDKRGMQNDLISLLRKHGLRIKEKVKLHDWETGHADGGNVNANYFVTYLLKKSVLGLRPSFNQKLQGLCTKLLEIAWLERDIELLGLYLKNPNSPMKNFIPIEEEIFIEDEYTETYKDALKLAELTIEEDEKASKKFHSSLKEEVSKIAVSGAFSLGTWNPVPLGVQVARSGINTMGHYIDPKSKNAVMQMSMLIANSGIAKAVGGNPFHIAQGLAVDAIALSTAPKKTTKEEANLRGIGLACVKGVLTLNPVKFAENALGQVIADGSREFVPEEKEKDGIGLRLIRSMVVSPDLHGALVDSIVKDPPKNSPKKDTGKKVEVDPDDESQFPKQIITEIEIKPTIKSEEQGNDPKRIIADGKITLEELKYRVEHAQWEQHNLQLRAAQDEVIQKDAGVRNAEKYLKDKTNAYNKKVGLFHFAAEESRKLDNAHKNLKTAEGELKTAQENLKSIQNVVVPEPIKPTTTTSHQNTSQPLGSPPKALPIYYGLDKDDKNDFRIYIFHEGKTPKAVGRFDSENKAVGAVNELNDYVRQVNTQNAELHSLKLLYESFGLDTSTLPKQFDPIYTAINDPGDKSKTKVYLGDKEVLKTSNRKEGLNTFKGLLSDNIAENNKALDRFRAELNTKAPKHIIPPTGNIKAPINNNDGNYHHLSYIDDSGKTQGLGKYDNAEGAKQVSGGWSHHQVKKADLENRCYEGQRQLFEQGVPIEKIRQIPNFETPTLDGKDAEKSCQKIAESNVRNTKMATAYLNELKALAKDPLKIEGLSKSEINHMSQDMMPKIKDAKEHGFFYDAYRTPRKVLQWLDDHGVSLNVNVNMSTDLYKTKTKESTPSHVGNYGYDAPKQKPLSNVGQWENVQASQRDQLFNMNMDYQSPVDNSPQGNLDYQQFWGQGLNPNAQIPPSDLSGLGKNEQEHRIPGMKHYPDGDRTQSNIPKWLRYFASGGETIDPQERIDRNTQSLVATAKVAGQAFGEIADELRSFGCVNAKFDQGKVTLRFDRTISSQIDGLMEQFLPNMDHVPNFRYVEFTARIANDIMLQAFMMPLFQAQKAGPLIDRVLVRPKGFGQEVRAIEAFQQPALRSGFVTDKAVANLAERNVSKIRTDWVLPKKGGATINSRWYTEHALERMAPRTPSVMAELERRFLERARKEGCLPQTKEFGKWMEKNAPNPRNIPPSVVEAEISKPGSTNIRVELNQTGDVITVIPGGKK